MCGDGVSNVSAGVGETVNGNRSYIGVYCKVRSLWGQRLVSTASWQRLEG